MKRTLQKKADSITYGTLKTPFGACVAALGNESVLMLAFVSGRKETELVTELTARFPDAALRKDDEHIRTLLKDAFGSRAKTPLFLLKGTDFQMRVWNTLLSIPTGKTVTYTELAQKIGSPKAVRAVGTACGNNPIALLIPCHRVLASGGKLGGYRWGIEKKKEILDFELSQTA